MIISILQRESTAPSLATMLQLDPHQVEEIELGFGRLWAFFPNVADDATELVLMLEVAPEKLPREGNYLGSGHPLQAFVHWRAFASSSLMAVALQKLAGRLVTRELVPLHLEITATAVACNHDATTLQQWLGPWGYTVESKRVQRISNHPEWGNTPCVDLILSCMLPLPTALQQLAILLCALDPDHVHWVGREATLSLIHASVPFLEYHPEQTAILAALQSLPYTSQRTARGGLAEPQDSFALPPKRKLYRNATEEAELAQSMTAFLHTHRCTSVLVVMPESPLLTERLATTADIARVMTIDLVVDQLQAVAHTLNAATIPIQEKQKITLSQASPLYQNADLKGFDALVLEGILDKLPSHQWPAMEATLFKHCQPRLILVVHTMGKAFRAWATAAALEHQMEVEIAVPKISESPKGIPLALAVFTAPTSS